MIKIHDKLWYIIGSKSWHDSNLAYMTYYEENKAFDNRKETGLLWSGSKEDKAIILDNTPRTGFIINKSVSRWSTQNKLFRVQDPEGFVVEVPTGNISTLLKYVTVIQGVIQEPCCWGREGNNHILLPKGSEPYELALSQTKQTKEAVTLAKLGVGDIVKFSADASTEYRYLGKCKYVWQFDWYTSKGDSMEKDFTEISWRHLFEPISTDSKYSVNYERKSSGKVILVKKSERNYIPKTSTEKVSRWDNFKDVDDYLDQIRTKYNLYRYRWGRASNNDHTRSIKEIILK